MENIIDVTRLEISAQSMYHPSDEFLEEMNTSMHKNLHNLRRRIINHRWHYDTFAFICRKTLLCFMHCVKSVFATRYASLSLLRAALRLRCAPLLVARTILPHLIHFRVAKESNFNLFSEWNAWSNYKFEYDDDQI